MAKKYKVLMALMMMEIGGAETHVLELSKALAKMDIDVYVVSNGGVFVKELEEHGIKHFSLPLHNKQPQNLLKSYFGLKKIITENNIRLVHAHARIPAFLCGILKNKIKFHFVTTTHFVFKTEFPFNILTNWGERSIAVSEDLKRYLVDNYNVTEENILVTINGIDIEKFSASTDYSDVMKEFGFDKNKKRIISICRMDKEANYWANYAAHKLLDCADELLAKEPDVEIVLVGDGNDFKNIKAKADKINDRFEKKVVYMTGARTDINKLLACSHIFLGISRSALEAMATEKPIILAGDRGYIGIYSEDKKDIAFATNFCCRDCPEATPEKILQDCLFLLSQDESVLNKLGSYGRATIQEHYSVTRMALDAKNCYDEIKKNPLRKMDVMISGYYGSKNSGDEAVLRSIVESLRQERPNIKITVLSRRPEETKLSNNVKSIYWLNVFSILSTMKNTELLISGGGNLMQDETSTRTLLYYLSIIKCARLTGAKVMLYANGIGPLNKEKNRQRVKDQLNQISLLTIREEKSLEELKIIGITKPHIEITADAAFTLEIAPNIQREESLNGKYFIISIRSWKHLDSEFEEKIARFADYVKERYKLEPVCIAMQPQYDLDISKRVSAKIKSGATVLIKRYSVDEMLNIVQNSEFVLGMRLHTLIYAAKAGVPVIALGYGPKVEGIMDYMKQDFMTSVENVQYENIISYVDTIMENKDEISKKLKEQSKILKEKAGLNAKHAIALLEE